MDITTQTIIAAYQRSEILPVARTWDTRASLPDGRSVACGCALVALCRAAGIDPEPIIAGEGMPYGRLGPLEYRLANALGLSEAAGDPLRPTPPVAPKPRPWWEAGERR